MHRLTRLTMSLTLKIKESRLSPDGLFFLRAARSQSIENGLALRADDNGYVHVDLGANGERPAIIVADGDQTIPWTIPDDLLDAYRTREIGPWKLINEAGRHLRQRAVVGLRWTIRDWIAAFGEQYGISSQNYVQKMCRGQIVGRSAKDARRQRKPYKAKLPAPFRSIKDGEQWFITV